jgi:pimeloyl-ACP methyl ester carboxylesterase/DNA-binding SARP family transcriptional activator/predicted ATPase
MAARLRIDVLGDLQVRRGGEIITLPPSRKTRALLAYLVVLGRPQRREKLCEMFWDVPDDPRGALRWSLSKIRTILNGDGQDRIAADRNTVQIAREDIDVDLAEFDGVRPDDVPGLPTKRLITLDACFRGSFLEDLSISRCPEFEAWRTFHANELELVRLRILRTLVDRLADEPDRALPYLHRLRMLDPDDATLGPRAEALADAARTQSRTSQAPRQELPPAPNLQPSPARPIADDDQRRPIGQELRFCTAPDGVRIAFACSGEGPPILRAAHWMSHLQHDWESLVWRHWMEGLSRENRLIRYDERGNGMSDWDVPDLSFDLMLGDLETVVDAAGLDRFTLLGVSQSCALSVAYAVRHPERVAGLILYGGYVKGWRKRGDPEDIATREALATLMRAGWGQNNPVFRQLFTMRFIPGATAAQAASFDELQRITVSPENAWRLQNLFSEIDVSDLLPRVTVPTLVLHGRGDCIASFDTGRAFATGIPGARLVELDSANHILTEQEPAFEVFLREVRSFTKTVSAAAPRRAPVPEGRRQVTVLTAEVVNPDSMLDFTDPEEDELAPLQGPARVIVAKHGGTVVGSGPNELTAAFGVETAREDHALQACRAALEMARGFEAVADRRMILRIGIDSGDAVVREVRTGDRSRPQVSGSPIQVSRRLVHSLQRGVIAATDRSRNAVGGYACLVPLDHEACPSFPSDWPVYELLSERRAVSRWHLRASAVEHPLVGREAEMLLLDEEAARALQGAGRTVAILGEAGLGKSRLSHEFLAKAARDGFRAVECGALEPDGNIPWALVKRLLQSLIKMPALCAGGAEGVTALLASLIGDRVTELATPLLFVLDRPVADQAWGALPAPARAKMVEDAVVATVAAAAAREPLVILAEDLHWADSQSLSVVRRIVTSLESLPVLAIVTSRDDAGLPWLAAARPVALEPFDEETTLAFVRSILGSDPSVSPLTRTVAERTGGNPLFAEEVVSELVQTGRLEGEVGAYVALNGAADLAVPPTVQSVTAARLGKLDERDRTLLQAASVVGREIRVDLLQSIAGLDRESLDRRMTALEDAGFLVERAGRPVRTLAFRHALIEEAVRGTLLADRRRALHARIVQALEGGEFGDESIERLAEHALRAELWEPAARYLLQAAQKALFRSAHATAIAFVERGLEAIARLPETTERNQAELDLQKASGLAWMAARGWGSPEVGKACARAEELCRLLDDPAELFIVLRGRAQYYMIGGAPQAAQDVTRLCQDLTRGSNDEGVIIETHHMVWTNGFFIGDYTGAIDSAEQSRRIYRADAHHGLTYQYSGHDPGVCCRCFAGLSYWQQGRLAHAEEACRDAVTLADRLGHPLTTAIAFWGMGYLHLFRSEPGRCLEWAEKGVRLCDEFALPLLRSQNLFLAGWATASLGDLRHGLGMMTDAIDAIRATGAEMGLPYFLALTGEATARAGDKVRALALVDEAIESARRNGARFQFSEFLRTRAEILAGTGAEFEEVEALLRDAMRSAGRQGALLGELRAATHLARYLTSRRRMTEARDLLAPYAGLVAEADGTAEAREARALM